MSYVSTLVPRSRVAVALPLAEVCFGGTSLVPSNVALNWTVWARAPNETRQAIAAAANSMRRDMTFPPWAFSYTTPGYRARWRDRKSGWAGRVALLPATLLRQAAAQA